MENSVGKHITIVVQINIHVTKIVTCFKCFVIIRAFPITLGMLVYNKNKYFQTQLKNEQTRHKTKTSALDIVTIFSAKILRVN